MILKHGRWRILRRSLPSTNNSFTIFCPVTSSAAVANSSKYCFDDDWATV